MVIHHIKRTIARSCDSVLKELMFRGNIIYIQYTLSGGGTMAISYNRLWKLLVDKKMSKADLRKQAGLAPNTMTKLRRDEPVAMLVLEKICAALDTDFGDIVEYVKDVKEI